ncbi:hypothetical protein ABT300_19015 [Streptomyces sp. NPDC001027]|uniref:hypothetical protein n=1 Tax=Streptomyces sp. NPDC001027 TaxID=3154771 RepID=UPI00332E34A6
MTTPDEVAVGDDWPSTFAKVPDWITLHPDLKAQAVRAYAFLAMHAPTDGRRRIAFPGQTSIARALQVSRADKVIPYLRSLEQVGAIRTEEIATPKGRANRYVLRFNPPPGYTGPTCLRDFYGARKDDVESPWGGWSAATAPLRPSSTGSTRKEGYPREEVDPSTREQVDGSTREQGSKKTNRNQTKEDQDPAPSARSAADVRRTGAGSSARGNGGSAATGKPVLTGEERRAVRAVGAALPRPLLAALPGQRIPGNNHRAVLAALDARTIEQVAERIGRRWVSWGFEPAFHLGEIRNPIGAAMALIGPTPYCPDPSCEDRVMVDTGAECRACAERRANRRAAYNRGEDPRRTGGAAAPRAECVDCGRPLVGDVLGDGTCRGCRDMPVTALAALKARWAAEDRARAETQALEEEAARRREARRAADEQPELAYPQMPQQGGPPPF